MTTRLFRLMTLAMFGVMLVAGAAQAADDKDAKIAIVDTRQVFQTADAAKHVHNQLEEKRKEYQKEIAKKETQLRDAEQELRRQQSLMAPEAFAKERDKFQEQVMSAQKMVQENKRTLDNALKTSMDTLEAEITKVVAAIAEEQKITVVLSRESVILAEKTLDITPEVIKRLNKNIKSIPVKWK